MPANGIIRVDFSSMDGAASSIDQAANRMQGQLEALQQYTNRATSAWEGSARDSYARLQQDWNRTHDELIQNLRRSPMPCGPHVVAFTRWRPATLP